MDQVSNAAQAGGGAKREIVLVSGMHRSGTSAFARVCNLAGGALPHPLVEPAVGNELGHWEPAEVVAMNDRALLSAGGDVNSVVPVSPAWLRSEPARQFTAEVEGYIARLGDGPQTWFIKDPRIALLAGLWSEGVERTGVVPRFVVAFRNPWEVAASLTKRQLHHFPDEVWPVERGLSLWLNYMLAIERKTRGLPRSFVSYEGFLGDWSGELSRVFRQLGLAPPQIDEEAEKAIGAFLRPDERHARHEVLQTRSGLATRVYEILLERVADPDGDRAALDKAGQAFAASFDVLGGYIGALEARTLEFSPLKAEASRVEAEARALKQDVQTLEARMMHLARAAASSVDAAAPSEDSALQRKHEALKTAHRQNVLAFQTVHLGHEAAIAQLSSKFENELQAKDELLTESKRELAAVGRALQQGAQEMEDGREAYEALRLETAELHGRMRAAEAVLANAVPAQAELALIHRSRSWRLTAPLRLASVLFGRR